MPPVATAEIIAVLLAPIAGRRHETCVVLYLGAADELLGSRHIVGQASRIDVSIRRLAVDALAFGARSVVMAHNHPSGDAGASRDDLTFTRRLAQGLDAIGVDLLDHLILAAGSRPTSLRAHGFL